MKRTITLASILLMGLAQMTQTINVSAQTNPGGYLPCGTDEAMKASLANDPMLRAQYEENERIAEEQDRLAFMQGYPKQNAQRSGDPNSVQSPPTYVIPVVFHIVHDYGSENISDAQVLDQMRILNEDYRKLNADTNLIVSAFTGIADDAEIEFRLAALDPNGNCTNGIDRVASLETYVGDDGSKLNYWTRSKYLNVWVVKAIGSGAAGYAYLPGGAPSAATDGIIILSNYIGSIGTGNTATSRALTHEVGHFLNLKHTWGNSNTPGLASNCSDDDGVTDTPNTIGWTSCNLNGTTCSSLDNVQNYMDYSYCTRMFTNGQRARMWNALNSATGQRNSLWTAATATATGINNPQPCAPIADFSPSEVQYVCAGSSLTFTDYSYNGQPTAYAWTFPGGTPATSTDSVPTITYNTPGTYSVSLTVSNAQGSDNFSRTNYVVVLPAAAQYNGWTFYESLENTTSFTADWDIINPSGNTWTNSTWAATTGTHSARIDNTTSMAGGTDDLISPTIDLSVMQSPSMTFNVAFARRTSADADRLRVYVSLDCGKTWNQRYSKQGGTLATAPTTTSSFVPTAAQWRTETVTFNAAQMASSNVRVKFEFYSDGGNDIYIDDINIFGATGVMTPEDGISSFDVYPNPAQDNTTVEFSLEDREQINVELVDMTGRVVQQVYTGELASGVHRFPVQTAELSAGIYLVRLLTDEGKYLTRKLVVE